MASGYLKVGIWQDSGVPGNISANLEVIDKAAKNARLQGIELLIFPECFLTGYYRDGGIAEIASKVNNVVHDRLAEISTHNGVALLLGFYEKSGNRIFNSAVCISPSQGEIARYRKRALYGDWEKSNFARGTEISIFEYRGFKIAILICFDIEFPELPRELATLGVALISVPTALMVSFDNITNHMIATRAMENQVYIAYSNRIGLELDMHYGGASQICSPLGEILIKASTNKKEMLSMIISLDEIRRARSGNCYLEEINQIR